MAATVGLCVGASSLPACNANNGTPVSSPCGGAKTCQVNLTLLHTADIHSRLFAYDQVITQVDSNLGLGTLNSNAHIGGVSRLSYLINRERARSDRVLHLDSGDVFEGAPIFNFYLGEPEMRYQSMIGVDAAVIGNHEFDKGLTNLVKQYERFAKFPILAANYDFEITAQPGYSDLATVASPYTVFNSEGLKVAVIGMGNLSSIGSIFDTPNSLGTKPLNTHETAQFYIDLLRPYVDVVVMLTHLGLESDQDMVRNTTGIDVVLGGHNHIVINPPQQIQDCSADPLNPGYVWEVDPNSQISSSGGSPPYDAKHPDPVNHPWGFHRPCKPRNVLIAHSGAFAKYLGRLDLILSNDPKDMPPAFTQEDITNNGFEVVSHQYTPFPVTEDVPEDPVMVDMLQPYQRALDRVADLDILVGFSPEGAKRIAGNGGDSPLGNLIATGMWLRLGIQTDFSLTNSTGIRTDLNPGPITIEEIYNIFPFDNSITKMQLSGLEVEEMFDFVARRSASRGCASQAQIAGARVQLNCAGCARKDAQVACVVDLDCPSQAQGACQNGKCIIEACAEEIYIGHQTDTSGNFRKCTLDTDCPEKLPGQCDQGPPGGNAQPICLSPVAITNLYELATSNYLAAGGSGFRVLQRNTTQFDTKIQQRDALIDYLRQGKPCGYDKTQPTDEGLKACSQDSDCSPDQSIVCACAGHAAQQGTGESLTCSSTGQCDPSQGRCVRADCRDQVAQFHSRRCNGSPNAAQCATDLNACSLGGEECKFLACVDETIGNFSDNRVLMLGK
jgi:5'-nucleotidase